MVKPKNKHSLSHVRHDPAHCLAPGLFRALKRGERKRSKLDVTYDYGDGKRIEFSGPEPLGADDLRILQGYKPMITENERDRRTAAWLIETYGAEAVAEAETRIAGARKPYPSNIAKVLGATLPESLKRTENAAARQKLAELRRMLDEHLS